MASLDSAVDLLHVFGDATRVRLMALLSAEELSVVELVSILELPQSRVSTHLGRLRDAGLLRDRKAGASTFYSVNDGAMPEGARRVWELLQQDVADGVLEADRRRCQELKRASATQAWPDSIAGEMERHYSPGRTWEAMARGLIGFVRLGDVLDVGAGDGVTAGLLAGRSKTYTCLDKSPRMIEAAKRRLVSLDNVSCEVGDMHALPFADESFDQVLLFHTLTCSNEPAHALAEAARVLRPHGTIAVVTLAEHEQGSVTAAYGHVQTGFSPEELERQLERAELSVERCAVTSRERRRPFFEVISAFASKPAATRRKNGAASSRAAPSRSRRHKPGAERADGTVR
jgi:SAM-dependent methyltransferase